MKRITRCGALLALLLSGSVTADEVYTGRQAWEIARKTTCGTLEAGVTRFGVWQGKAYSRVPGERDRHLFNLIGVNTRQCADVQDPDKGEGFRSVSREVMLYLDPETGALLDQWENPWTGQTVEVLHVANDPVNMRAPRFAADGGEMKMRRYGDLLVSASEVPLFYDNPLGGDFQDMLRCIRCGACMNHCPVYHAVGGHAYGWVYPGPMGAVLTPSLIGVAEAGQLPNASTFCGRCESVCPMRIPLPKMMRHWREREFERHLSPASVRMGLGAWAFFAQRPRLYGLFSGLAARALARLGGRKGRLSKLPLASGWTKYREMPAPEGKTFQQLWAERQRKGTGS